MNKKKQKRELEKYFTLMVLEKQKEFIEKDRKIMEELNKIKKRIEELQERESQFFKKLPSQSHYSDIKPFG